MYLTRRDFVKLSAAAGAGAALPMWAQRGWAEALASGLSDPAKQPKFAYLVPNALDPGFMYSPDRKGRYKISISDGSTRTGLVNKRGRLLKTDIFGYKDGRGSNTVTWPGRTFQVRKNSGETRVRWHNDLPNYHLLPVDTSLHWAYSLEGYQKYSIERNGVPIITHVHGGHSDFQFDGNPEFFYSPDAKIVGPQWDDVPGGFTMDFRYENDVPAGNLWYHDHALGLTRLNVYAGMAGFYFVRDDDDTGEANNPLGLPAFPYEMALAVQDRMFTKKGSLFYPAFPGDPAWEDFITGEGRRWSPATTGCGCSTAATRASWWCASASPRARMRPIWTGRVRRCRSKSSAATRAWRARPCRPISWCSSQVAATTSSSTSRRRPAAGSSWRTSAGTRPSAGTSGPIREKATSSPIARPTASWPSTWWCRCPTCPTTSTL
jgi:hypothetical protein